MEIKIIYTAHVLTQMFKRGISREEIKHVLREGVVIKVYPDDQPFPSNLILGFSDKRPLHIVYAVNESGDKIIINVYQPDHTLWNDKYDIKK